MKSKLTLKLFSILLSVSILFASCVSSTLIQSYPTGAKVYINGEYAGRTPYWYSDTKVMGSTTNIDLVKEGYQPLYTSIVRSERLDVGAIIGGFYLWAPFLWSLRYNPVHSYELVALSYEPQLQVEPQQSEPQPVQENPINKRLKELKQLLDENVITKEDFEKQKQRILNEI